MSVLVSEFDNLADVLYALDRQLSHPWQGDLRALSAYLKTRQLATE